MIDIGSTHFKLTVPSLPREELERYSSTLFDQWAKHVEISLGLSDYTLELEIEDGSVCGKGKVLAALTLVYVGIGQYGSFINGLQTIASQVDQAGDYLAEKAGNLLPRGHTTPRVRKHDGSLDKLKRLFDRIYSGEMTPDDAMAEAQVILGDDASSAPSFMRDLHVALKEAPSQTLLSLHVIESEDSIAEQLPKRPSRPSPRPKPELPPPQQFRVVITQESKKGERKISVREIHK